MSAPPRLPLALPAVAVTAVCAAFAMAFLYAPTEALQGDVQRIFYVHVPAAWIAFIAFAIVAVASVGVLARPASARPLDRTAVASAEAGLVFTTINLLTGPIWGRRVWGVWWVWDARLTSTLVLWAIYAGYLLFRALTPAGPQRERRAAVIGIVGALDVPVIHFSVVWWRTLHPLPTVVRPGGPELPGEMLVTLLACFAALALVFVCFVALRVAIEDARDRLDALAAGDARVATRAEV